MRRIFKCLPLVAALLAAFALLVPRTARALVTDVYPEDEEYRWTAEYLEDAGDISLSYESDHVTQDTKAELIEQYKNIFDTWATFSVELTLTPEEHAALTKLDEDATSSEGAEWWQNYAKEVYEAASVESLSFPYYSYIFVSGGRDNFIMGFYPPNEATGSTTYRITMRFAGK